MAKAGPPTEEDIRRDRAAVFWKRVANAATVVQWMAMMALLVEAYFIWTKAPGVMTNWDRVLVFAIILGAARLVRIGGTFQFKRYR